MDTICTPPTDQYQSGTEEEIEAMLEMGKQVFMYFSDKTINPSNIDNAQYEKVKRLGRSMKTKAYIAAMVITTNLRSFS